jgi:cytochrome subunit of sulfide dehydrogenase
MLFRTPDFFRISSLLLALGAVALTLDCARAAELDGRNLAANCTGCHGTNGVSAGVIPTLAGMERSRMVLLMQEFRDGKRPATVMHQHAKGYTDAQIEAIAAWFAAQQ